MNSVNLIPAPRRAAKRRRVTVQAWVFFGLAYTVIVVMALLLSKASAEAQSPSLSKQLAEVKTENNELDQAIASLTPQLQRSIELLERNRAVFSNPDWSVLLVVVAEQLGERVVLENLRVLPAVDPMASLPGTPGTPGSPGPPGNAPGQVRPLKPISLRQWQGKSGNKQYRLELSGVGSSQQEVSQFAVRLQMSKLFDQVKLVQSQVQEFYSQQAVGFHITCWLGAQP